MKVCFDSLRITLAENYNKLAKFIKKEVEEDNIGDKKGVLEQLENVRESVGIILILADEHGEFSSLTMEMEKLEVAEVGE